MGIKFTNNFVTTISAGINNSVTTIPITSATGFPSLGASDYAYCSLQKESPFTLEIVKVTAVSGTNLTVVRGQDGTSASAFNSGDAFELRVTAGGINDVVTTAGAALPKAGGAMTGAVSFGDNNKAIFGSELEIYSDATHGRIREYGSGQLKIQGDNLQLLTSDGASTYLEGNASTSAVTLYHASNSPRLVTTSTGIDVTGVVTANPTGGVITLGASGQITSKQSLDVATAGGRYMGSSNRGLLGQMRIEQTAQGADGGYVTLDTCAVGSTSVTERMRVDSSGNVGIGTTSPADNLHLNESGATSSFIRFSNSNVSNGWSLGAHSGGRFQLSQNGVADRLVVDSSGNVGIGETTPLGTLHVKTTDSGATADASADDLVVENNSNTGISILSGASSTGSIYFGDSGSNWDGYIAYSQANRSMTLGAAQSPRMTILNTGNVGIGITAPTHKLHVKNDNDYAAKFGGTGGGDYSIEIGQGSTSSSAGFNATGSGGSMLFKVQDTEYMRIRSDGNVGIGTTSPSASLDVVTNTDAWTGEFTQSNTSNGDGVLVEVGSTAAADYALSVRTSAGNHPAFNVKADGNVGIGIFSPLDILHLNDPNDDCVLNLDTAIANKNSVIKFSDPDAQGRGFIQYAHWDDSLRTHVNGAEKMRIASAGQIGIGGANYGTDGQVLTSGGSGAAPAWEDAGGGGAYSAWAIKVSNYTASTGDQLICNSQSAFTVTLPASPSAGHTVIVKNVASGLITIGRNGSNINGDAENATLPIGNAAQLVYVASAIGWTVL